MGQSTILADAAAYDANDKIIKQWDAAALKVGTLTDKTRALLNEIALDGKNLGENVFTSFSTAITGVEDQLGKLVATGKANFRSLLTSLDEQIATAGIKKLFSGLAGGIEAKIFGGPVSGIGGGKRDGSTSSPFCRSATSRRSSVVERRSESRSARSRIASGSASRSRDALLQPGRGARP